MKLGAALLVVLAACVHAPYIADHALGPNGCASGDWRCPNNCCCHGLAACDACTLGCGPVVQAPVYYIPIPVPASAAESVEVAHGVLDALDPLPSYDPLSDAAPPPPPPPPPPAP